MANPSVTPCSVKAPLLPCIRLIGLELLSRVHYCSPVDLDIRGVAIPSQGFIFFSILKIARAHGSVVIGRVQIDVEEKNILVQLDTQRHLIAEEDRKTGRESRD